MKALSVVAAEVVEVVVVDAVRSVVAVVAEEADAGAVAVAGGEEGAAVEVGRVVAVASALVQSKESRHSRAPRNLSTKVFEI